jgi:5-methylthioribose kinase
VIGTNTTRLREWLSYRPLDAGSVQSYLRALGVVDEQLGTSDHWRADECGDGNLNLVFVVRGPSGSVVVKQALPYVRMVGDSWPLSVRRNYYEHAALSEYYWGSSWHAPCLIPPIFGYQVARKKSA